MSYPQATALISSQTLTVGSGNADDHVEKRYISAIMGDQDRYAHTYELARETSTSLVDLLANLPEHTTRFTHKVQNRAAQSCMIEFDDGVLAYLVCDSGNRLYAIVAAPTQAEAHQWMATIDALVPPVELRQAPDTVPVRFWHHSMQGATYSTRLMDAPPWREILINYAGVLRAQSPDAPIAHTPGSVVDQLHKLMLLEKVPPSGRIILWTGEPGTGKTRAIQTLFRQWKTWASSNYILDPEVFFSSPEYMTRVMLDSGDDGNQAGHARLVVIEDARDLIAENGQERSQTGLSRLLNLADGMIGQGTNTFVLVTTNEKITKVHPALKRPGRCLAQIEFTPLNAAEVDHWASYHEAQDVIVPKAQPLANLYAALNGTEPIISEKEVASVGFQR